MYNYKKLPTKIWGLKFRPTLGENDDTRDCIIWDRFPLHEFSALNHYILLKELKKLNNNCKCIVEIGVHRNEDLSSTCTLMDNKPNDCIYLGIDINDKSYLNDSYKNIHTIQTDSKNYEEVLKKLEELGASQIDLLFIDGWHSIEYVCDYDWRYAELLSPHGVVLAHDVSMHPGPYCHFDAVDENLFQKTKYFTDVCDFGIAVYKKL